MPSPDFTSSSDSPSTVGAGVAEPLDTHYFNHHSLLKWIHETKEKLPKASAKLRKEAFLADPLLKGTIYPYLKNVLLQGYTIQTKDNKLYAEAIEEITDSLDALNIMSVFKEDFLDFFILDGHSYRRIDPDETGEIWRLEKLESSSISTYKDPWIPSIVAYHQHARVTTGWTKNGTVEYYDSWFIPFGTDVKDIYATYVKDRGTGNNLKVFDLFQTYKLKYKISDENNLRIGSAERIIAMHNTEGLRVQSGYDDYDTDFYEPAPIDSVLLAIWLKRLLLVNAPNLIFVILSPFLHVKNGIVKETKDLAGNPILISSIPQKPSTALQTANPNLYSQQLANFENWISDTKAAMKNIMECLKNGGVFASGPDQDIKPIESSRNVTYQFIKGLIDSLDEEIGHNFGFPISLIKATGTELASSRNILQNFNTVHAGERGDYETVADRLIRKMFTGKTWQGEKGTYSFEDIKAHFVLDTPDTKDLLQQAQTFKTSAETLVQLKTAGASKEDLQALGEEYGFGLLGLDNYQEAVTQDQATQINAILKACLMESMKEQGLVSVASPTEPSGFEEGGLVKKLKEAYETARINMGLEFEEH